MAIVKELKCALKVLEPVWLGSSVKLEVLITSPGFTMMDDDFELSFSVGNKTITRYKSDLLVDEDGTWYVALDTAELTSGAVTMTTTAYIPDTDFASGVRVEIDKQEVFEILI